ncbi:MAG TPA: sugar ABC transporter permease, partial [Nonomuraea sp.]|nr:sugar ABC transporter permease [Nonomuraea sp.]
MAVSTGPVRAAGESARGRRHERPGRLRRSFGAHWYAWAMTTPVVVVMLVLIGWPLARGVYLSLTDATEANIGRTIGVNVIPATYEFVGLDNYVTILTSGLFWEKLA